jgi:hypothetical protein
MTGRQPVSLPHSVVHDQIFAFVKTVTVLSLYDVLFDERTILSIVKSHSHLYLLTIFTYLACFTYFKKNKTRFLRSPCCVSVCSLGKHVPAAVNTAQQ